LRTAPDLESQKEAPLITPRRLAGFCNVLLAPMLQPDQVMATGSIRATTARISKKVAVGSGFWPRRAIDGEAQCLIIRSSTTTMT
jgi:hypothetical protein